jgi:hypothetical protein
MGGTVLFQAAVLKLWFKLSSLRVTQLCNSITVESPGDGMRENVETAL